MGRRYAPVSLAGIGRSPDLSLARVILRGMDRRVTQPELLGTVALATDLGMGLPLESGLAICELATRFADALGVEDAVRRRVFYLALIGHVGCTAENHVLAGVVRDEMLMREHSALLDFGDPRAALGFMIGHARRTGPLRQVPLAVGRVMASRSLMRAGVEAVCEAGRLLSDRLGLDVSLEEDLDDYYEAWNGTGFPRGAREHAITLPVRIVHVAWLACLAEQRLGADAARAIVTARAGGQLDPDLVRAFLASGVRPRAGGGESLWEAVLALAPLPGAIVAGEALDEALAAIGDFADLKSPYLHGHSRGVAELAGAAAVHAGLPEAVARLLRRAGHVHDVGRVAVSAAVWGKRAPLTADDRERIRLHPYHAERVLDRAPALRELASVACLHHERLDGTGYHRRLSAAGLSPAARLLAAADVARAMGEERPHRAALPAREIERELRSEAHAGRLDGDAVDAVLAALAGRPSPARPSTVAGLTPRELEVLELLARGHSIKQVARELVIAPKTADAHIQHIYAKIGVSTRAGAALFAMRHRLVALDPDS
jgi:HD-GYP domain-containing protein (c-di-GMP phosphodiesterase class II)